MTDAPRRARSGCSPTRSTGPPRPTTRWSPSPRATTTSCAPRPRRSSTGCPPAARATGPARARPRLRLGRLDPGAARRLGGRAVGRPTASRSPVSTPRRAWSRRPREAVAPERRARRLRRRRTTSSRCRAARSTACSPPTCCATCPTATASSREVARVLRPGGALVIHDYSVAGNTRARALWAAVCHGIIIPLAVVKRSDVPLHRYLYTSVRDFDSVAAHLRAAAVEPASSTCGTGRTAAGSTASCTPSPGRRRRDPRPRRRAGPPGSTDGPCSTRRPRHWPRRMPRACRHPRATSSSWAVASRG